MYTPYTKEQEDDFDRFILPAYLQLARNDSLRFCVRDNQEKVIICSNDYANDIGYYDYNEAMNKRPDYEYERRTGTPEHFIMQMNYINSTKKSFNYTYINKTDNQLYLTITEPVFSPRGDIIGKKEIDTLLKPISHRGIIEKHFKRFNIDVVANKNIIQQIILSEQEELILFMLIAGYTQNEIGEFLKVSRSYILKLISEQLCPKFQLKIVSTKLLIEAAVSYGFANLVPDQFLYSYLR